MLRLPSSQPSGHLCGLRMFRKIGGESAHEPGTARLSGCLRLSGSSNPGDDGLPLPPPQLAPWRHKFD